MLDVKSSTRGVLIPRASTADIQSINNPANGLMIFNTNDDKLYIYISAELKWKEVLFGSGEILYPATLTIGTGGTCSNTTVNGSYYADVALTSSNTVTLDATVTSPGAWSIASDTINGYSFYGSGMLMTTGTHQVTLNGSGTPVANQTDTFTATVNTTGGTSCTFDVLVIIDCDDGDACTNDSYDTVSGSCVHTAIDCDDGDPTTTDSCNPATGQCTHTTINCDDNNPCTVDSVSVATGECVHTPKDCDDGDPTTTDSCDPTTGQCTHTTSSKDGKKSKLIH